MVNRKIESCRRAHRNVTFMFMGLSITALSGPSGAQDVAAARFAETIVDGARPVAKAMVLLSREHHWLITYEDPPYVHDDDLRDLTTHPIGRKRLIVPRGGSVIIPARGATDDPAKVIEAILNTEETLTGHVRRFDVLRLGSLYNVVPAKVLDSAGNWRPIKPVLSTSVKFVTERVTVLEYLNHLCEATSRTSGASIKVGRVPSSLAYREWVPPGEREGVARSLLYEALVSTATPPTWVVFYDPSTSTYFLHVGDLDIMM